jgi:hypothetical protein
VEHAGLLEEKETSMARYRIMGASLYDSHHQVIAKTRGNTILDGDNQRIGVVRGDELFDSTDKKMMSVKGADIFDESNVRVASMVDVSKALDGAAGSVVAAALWYCFVR